MIRIRYYIILAILACFAMQSIGAQAVYTKLKDPKDIQTFTEISHSIVCQCGCGFVLSNCPHVECPFGIPVRRFIENRIREGKSTDEILQGLYFGFGPEVMEDPIVKQLQEQGREDLVRGFQSGFTKKISSKTSSPLWYVVFALGAALLIFLGRRFVLKRKSSTDQIVPSKESLQNKFKDLDR